MIRLMVLGFIAGVVATLVFHQGTVWLLSQVMAIPFGPWSMRRNAYGVPMILALSFWAGVWGIVLAWLLAWRPALPDLLTGFVLGAIVPSVWGWTVIATLHGRPLFAGGNVRAILLVLFIDGVWGWATVLLLRAMQDTGRPVGRTV